MRVQWKSVEKNLQVDVSSPRLQSPGIPRSGAKALAALDHSLQPAEQLGSFPSSLRSPTGVLSLEALPSLDKR